jgi:thiopeptide-type bacteriocin biosynthesis protein
LIADGRVWKLQLDTYERELERYGGDAGIALAEQLFWIDSDAVLGIVELLDGDAGADARWRLALRALPGTRPALGLSPDDKLAALRRARDTFIAEFGADVRFERAVGARFRTERAAIEALVTADAAALTDHPLAPGIELLTARDARLRPVGDALRARDASGALSPPLADIVWSYLHMHANRLLRSEQRAQERVLYDFLARIYASQKARG